MNITAKKRLKTHVWALSLISGAIINALLVFSSCLTVIFIIKLNCYLPVVPLYLEIMLLIIPYWIH